MPLVTAWVMMACFSFLYSSIESRVFFKTEGGDRDKLGRGCLWNGEIENCIHQNHIFSVQTNDRLIIRTVFLPLILCCTIEIQHAIHSIQEQKQILLSNWTITRNLSFMNMSLGKGRYQRQKINLSCAHNKTGIFLDKLQMFQSAYTPPENRL